MPEHGAILAALIDHAWGSVFSLPMRRIQCRSRCTAKGEREANVCLIAHLLNSGGRQSKPLAEIIPLGDTTVKVKDALLRACTLAVAGKWRRSAKAVTLLSLYKAIVFT